MSAAKFELPTILPESELRKVVGFKLRPPNKNNREKTFRIMKRWYDDRGIRQDSRLDHPAVEAINRKLVAGKITPGQAKQYLGQIVERLRAELEEIKTAAIYDQQPAPPPPPPDPVPLSTSETFRTSEKEIKYNRFELRMPSMQTKTLPVPRQAARIVDSALHPEINEIRRDQFENVVGFYVRPPAGKHKVFRIFKHYKTPNESIKTETLRLRAISQINKTYLAEQAAEDPRAEQRASEKIHLVRDQLLARLEILSPKTPWLTYNLKILYNYFSEVYASRPIQANSKESMWWKLVASVEDLGGDISLEASDIRKIETRLYNKYGDRTYRVREKLRARMSRINQLLSYVGIPRHKLLKPPPAIKPEEVNHLTLEELTQVLSRSSDSAFMCLCFVAFHTGMRFSEIFALRPEQVRMVNHNRTMQLDVKTQLRPEDDALDAEERIAKRAISKEPRKYTRRLPKRGKMRKALVLDEGQCWIRHWFTLDDDIKDRLMRSGGHNAEKLKELCRGVFPRNPYKHCRFHDLRHSNAIHLISDGGNLSSVARHLGNSVAVCEHYYVGYVQSDRELVALHAEIVSKRKALGEMHKSYAAEALTP